LRRPLQISELHYEKVRGKKFPLSLFLHYQLKDTNPLIEVFQQSQPAKAAIDLSQ
jgi:hypothetical protein